MGNLFEGISRLYMKDGQETIHGMSSAEGETIEFFPREIRIRQDKGIEDWLKKLEDEMVKVIQKRTKDAFAERDSMNFKDWFMKFSG